MFGVCGNAFISKLNNDKLVNQGFDVHIILIRAKVPVVDAEINISISYFCMFDINNIY
jgi:hypothetical protein